MDGYKFIDVLEGIDVEKCYKMNQSQFDKLNPCTYLQVVHA